MSTFEPESFGKYFLVDKIATGGMAEIFKAKTFSHGGFENLVVIKRILAHLSENQDFVEMFIDEAKVSVALQHQNIVRIYDFGKIINNYFIAMECIEGKDVRGVLRKLSKQRRYLPLQYAIYIAHEVCRGLDYAHSKTDMNGYPYGIVHRDMSPSNVLVSYEGDVKIADFGIAKTEQNTYTTADGVLKGKFEYMSPEQASGEDLDNRSDLFSVGIMLYEMLTGRRLFKTDSDVKTLGSIKACEVKPPSELTSRVPGEIEVVVMKALSRDPADRYQTAADMRKALRLLLPENLDAVHHDLATFLAGVFEEEISTEAQRLASGSAIAVEWRDNSETSQWDGHTQTHTIHTNKKPSRRAATLFIGVAVLLFLLVGGAAALGTAIALWPNGDQTIAEALPVTGTLDITVLPAAKIMVNGVDRGHSRTLVLPDLEPGDYAVVLVAEGHDPHEQTVNVVEGTSAKIVHMFEGKAPEPDEPAVRRPRTRRNKVQASPPQVSISSTPEGASVLIDGDKVGTTPMVWRDGAAGSSHQVQLQMPGYRSAQGSLTVPKAGARSSFDRPLSKIQAAAGTVTVSITGGGWGHVYIDGKQQSKPAPGRYDMPPGTHELRVVNEELGLDHREKIDVSAGGRHTVRVRPR